MKLSTCYLTPDLMMMTRFLSFFLSELPAEEGELFWGLFLLFPLIILQLFDLSIMFTLYFLLQGSHFGSWSWNSLRTYWFESCC